MDSMIESWAVSALRTLPMQDSITESKTINYILFMIFY